MPIVSERDRETATEIADLVTYCTERAGPGTAARAEIMAAIATALTRARAEGVREGVERAIEAIEKCKLRPNSMLSGTGMAAVHDGALNDALRALADSPATTELDREG